MYVDFKSRWRPIAALLQVLVLSCHAQWSSDHKAPVDTAAGADDHWWNDDQWANTQPVPSNGVGSNKDPWASQHAWSSINDEEGSGASWDSNWNNFGKVQQPGGQANEVEQHQAFDPYLAASQPWDAGSGNFAWDDEDAVYTGNVEGIGGSSWHDAWDKPGQDSGSSPFDKIDTDRIPPPPMPAGAKDAASTTERPDSWWIQPDSNPVYTLPPTSQTTVMPPWYAAETTSINIEPATARITTTTAATSTTSTASPTTSTSTTSTQRATSPPPAVTSTQRTTYWDDTTTARNPYWEVTTKESPQPTDTSISIYDTRPSLKDRFVDLFFKPGILAALIGGLVVGVIAAILLIFFIVYRMRKKDEGSYALDEPKSPAFPYAYQKAATKEFYA